MWLMGDGVAYLEDQVCLFLLVFQVLPEVQESPHLDLAHLSHLLGASYVLAVNESTEGVQV